MNKPAKRGKGQGRRGKGCSRAARGKVQPGIIESWEDFNAAAMEEYLAAVAEDFNEQMDSLEEALRCEN